MREIDINEDEFQDSNVKSQRKVSSHFITDGKERAVQYNYKVTVQKCEYDENVNKTEENDFTEGFIV